MKINSFYFYPFLGWLILSLITNSLSAQKNKILEKYNNLKISNIAVEDGLTQGSVYSILKDSRGFLWFTSYEGLNRFDGHQIKAYQHTIADSFSLKGNNTVGLIEDRNGDIWVGSEFCLNRYVRKNGNFRQVWAENEIGESIKSENYPFYADSLFVWYTNSEEGILKYNISTGEKYVVSSEYKYERFLYVINSTKRTRDGSIWVRRQEGLIRINPETGLGKWYFSNHSENVFGEPTTFFGFFEGQDENIWLPTSNRELIKFNYRNSKIEKANYTSNKEATITAVLELDDGTLFLGTEGHGLYIYHLEYGLLNHIHSSRQDNLRLGNNSATTLYLDHEGIIWINSDPEAIHALTTSSRPFRKYGENLFNHQRFTTTAVRCFEEMPDGKIWIGMLKDGVTLFNPATEKLEAIYSRTDDSGYESDHATSFLLDNEGKLWSATYEGLYLFDEKAQRYQKVINNAYPEKFISANTILGMIEMPDNHIVFTSEAGIFYLDKKEQKTILFKPLKGIVSNWITRFDNQLFVTENNNGFYLFDYNEWVNNPNADIDYQHFLPSFHIKHTYQSPNNSFFWIATSLGLLKVEPSADWKNLEILKTFTTKEGLPSNYVYSVLPDEKGNLWLSTNRGISCFNPLKETFKNFDLSDNLQGFEFNTNAFLKTRSGEIYFGGTNGFNRFIPAHIAPLDYVPKNIQIIDFQVNGKHLKRGGNIGEATKMDLAANENTFTISYSAMDYFSDGGNFYKVKLSGFDKDWLNVEQNTSVRYTNIPPGDYIFSILAANKDGTWMEQPKELHLHLAKAWYQSRWFYALSLTTIAGLIFAFYKLRIDRKIAAERTKQLEESEAFKNRFFENISHEFRTPLTIITGLTNELTQNTNTAVKKKLRMVADNAAKLLDLVNQMLDLAKFEGKNMTLSLSKNDIISYLEYLVNAYQSYAYSKELDLQFYSEIPKLVMDFDDEKLQRVISNLLSNAIKFTPKYGKIIVVAKLNKTGNRDQLEIRVKDNGIGIASEEVPFIFGRFYQAGYDSKKQEVVTQQQGTGIGLALVAEIVKLMKGNILVESSPEAGTIFFITLPIQNDPAIKRETTNPENPVAPIPSGKEGLPTLKNSTPFHSSEKPSILIVEDNKDVIYYLQTCLGNTYHCEIATNGQDGVKAAISSLPDLVISDIMMPVMDGYELCRTLKKDPSTDHIPIILLTARADHSDKLSGLQSGADAYLIKPFEKEELLVRIENLMTVRKSLQKKYQTPIWHDKAPGIENKFLQKVNKTIEKHLDDASFNINYLCHEVKMSRSTIHKKIKALTGLTTTQYIRGYRLLEAQKLLITKKLSIAEVAYQTGFNSPSWFTQAYKQKFGHAPSETRK